MTFVPVSSHVPVDPPSPRTRELAELLGRVIEEYEKHHPSVTGSEVRAALRLAGQSSGDVQPAVVAMVVGVALLVVGVVAFLAVGGGDALGDDMIWPAAALGLASVIAVAFLLKRVSGR